MLATAASYYVKLWDLNNENDIVSVKERSSCMPHGSSNVLCMEWTQDCKYKIFDILYLLEIL